jgi:hypothetical protein
MFSTIKFAFDCFDTFKSKNGIDICKKSCVTHSRDVKGKRLKVTATYEVGIHLNLRHSSRAFKKQKFSNKPKKSDKHLYCFDFWNLCFFSCLYCRIRHSGITYSDAILLVSDLGYLTVFTRVHA